MPSPYRMSKSASRNGGAILFLTTLTRVSLPTTSSPFFDGSDAANVEAHRCVELERVAAGGRFRIAEHHADLHAYLIDEDDQHIGALDVGGELAQRLAHQARLQSRKLIPHLTLDFGARHERGDGVDDDHIDASRAHQHVGDFEPLLARVRLRDQHVTDLDTELAGIHRVERILRVDIGCDATGLLHLRNDLETKRCLAGRLGPVHFDHAPSGQTSDAQGDVEAERPGRHDRQVALHLGLAHFHDRALAELLLDLCQRRGERLTLAIVHCVHSIALAESVAHDAPVGLG